MSDLSRNRRAVIPAPEVRLSPSSVVQSLSVDQDAGSASSRETAAKARSYPQPVIMALMFGLAALALLLPGIGTPPRMYFDEAYFVPEARALIQGQPNPAPDEPSLAKPPLGRLIISVGMEAAGDNPFGWRIAGVVCGALTVVAVYLWCYLLLEDRSLASLAAGLALFNNFLFVMSRIATVDVFLLFFLMWSLVAYTAALTLDVGVRTRRILFCASGGLVGLAGACKWNAIDTLAVFFLLTFALLWVSRRTASDSLLTPLAQVRNIAQLGLPVLLLGLILAPIAAYSLAFWPLCRMIHRPFSFRELLAMNTFIWHFSRTTAVNPFLISAWYSWPLNMSPMRALSYLVGNPVVTWSGLVALALCLRRFWVSDTFPKALVLLLFASNYFQWAVTPQKGLYYYYYYPCVMILGVGIAVATRGLPPRVLGMRIHFLLLAAAAVFFLRCYPQMAHFEAPWDCAFGCWP